MKRSHYTNYDHNNKLELLPMGQELWFTHFTASRVSWLPTGRLENRS